MFSCDAVMYAYKGIISFDRRTVYMFSLLKNIIK